MCHDSTCLRSFRNWNTASPLPRLETFRPTVGNLLTMQTYLFAGGTLTQDDSHISPVDVNTPPLFKDSWPPNVKRATTSKGQGARARSTGAISLFVSTASQFPIATAVLPTLLGQYSLDLTSSAFNRSCNSLSSWWCAIVSLSSACAACHATPPHTRDMPNNNSVWLVRRGEKSTTENGCGRARVSSGSDVHRSPVPPM